MEPVCRIVEASKVFGEIVYRHLDYTDDEIKISEHKKIDLNKLKCVDLKKMAVEKGIKTSIKVEGKLRQMTKIELIKALEEFV